MLKRVIITGGSGLVGRALVQRLSETEGAYETIVLSRNPSRVTGLPAGARAIGWDAKTAAGWGELADGAYAIINLAGENIGAGRWTAAKKASVIQSRVNAGQAVVEAITAAKIKPQVLVQASAIGFYGNRGDEVLTEASAAGDDFLAEVCQKWEGSVAAVAEMVRVVYLRTGVVLSTKSGALAKLMLPMRFFAGGPLGNGQQWFPWIHIDDEIELTLHLMMNEAAVGPYNLVAPVIEQNRSFIQKLGRVMGRPCISSCTRICFEAPFG